MARRFAYGIETEASIHEAVCDYLRNAHPGVIFRSDFAAGIKMTAGQAVKHKRLQSSRAYPDLFITEPSTTKHEQLDGATRVTRPYYGLFLELKRSDVTIYKKDGTLVANPHIREQAAVLEALRERGYKAEFACGLDEAIRIIREYLEDETQPLEEF